MNQEYQPVMWKQIRGSRYCVSRNGVIKRIGKNKGPVGVDFPPIDGSLGRGKALKRLLTGNQPRVFININPEDLLRGKAKWWSVAELVLETFVAPRRGNLIVRWKDGNRANCSVENLEWAYRGRFATHVPWCYRPEWTNVKCSLRKNGKWPLSVVTSIQKDAAFGVKELSWRFGMDPKLVKHIIDGTFNQAKTWEAKHLVIR